MLFEDQIIDLEIRDIAFGGNGVGTAEDGMTIFVPYSAPQDKLRVRITAVKKRFAEAEIVEIVEPSPWRVEPKDPLYTKHAASQYEHIAYEKQLEIKTSQLKAQLSRMAGIAEDSYTVANVVGSPNHYNYRNKLTLHPSRATEDYLNYGYYAHDNRTIIPIENSSLAVDEINNLIKKINRTKWGRKNATRQRPLDCTIRTTTNGDTHMYFGVAPVNYTWLKETINDREFRVPLGSFFQVNTPVAEKMFTQVADWISGIKAIDTAIDAYCGVGIFSAHLDPEMKVEAFDMDELAIECAFHNAMQLGLDNRSFTAGKDAKIFAQIAKKVNPSKTAVILDPPRTGCDAKALQMLSRKKFRAVTMVSCNPATMARDLKILAGENGGYDVKEVAIFDMFPQTAHFEAAALLTPRH